jgi:hypothetical protein
VLNGPDGPINDTKSMPNIVASFYQDLFSCEDNPNIILGSNF